MAILTRKDGDDEEETATVGDVESDGEIYTLNSEHRREMTWKVKSDCEICTSKKVSFDVKMTQRVSEN